MPANGTGIKVPNADPIVEPTAFAAALPGFSPIAREKAKSINPPTIGTLPNTPLPNDKLSFGFTTLPLAAVL